MAKLAHPRGTYDDILALPEHLTGQLIDGDLFVSPRPAVRPARAVGKLNIELDGPFDTGRSGPGGWWILTEPELHLGRDVLCPDLAGWRRDRVPRLPTGRFIELVPDWICEVLSPSNSGVDRARKLPRYAEAGVPHAWLIDPIARTLEVLERGDRGWLLLHTFTGEEEVRAAPFDAVAIGLGHLWLPEDEDEGGR